MLFRSAWKWCASAAPGGWTVAPATPRNYGGSSIFCNGKNYWKRPGLVGRPEAWSSLTPTEAAILDFLRRGGRSGEFAPDETVKRMLALLSTGDCYAHLVNVARTEPPRVRAMLGALGEHSKQERKILSRLRDSLNPLSRFEFGVFSVMPNARAWQAKEHR